MYAPEFRNLYEFLLEVGSDISDLRLEAQITAIVLYHSSKKDVFSYCFLHTVILKCIRKMKVYTIFQEPDSSLNKSFAEPLKSRLQDDGKAF